MLEKMYWVCADVLTLATQLAKRHNKLSAAIRETSTRNAAHTLRLTPFPERVSTRNFTPYCVLTEQATAATTAVRITRWEPGRSRT